MEEPPGAYARPQAPSPRVRVVDGAGGQIPSTTRAATTREVFIILDGQGTIVADGEEHDAPAGTYCRYAPEAKRTIRNDSDANVRALLIGVPVDSGYEQMPWG